MRDQHELPRFEREAIYDDTRARHVLGLAKTTLAQAREDGSLRYRRSGNRIVYLGEWLLEWMRSASEAGRDLTATQADDGRILP